MSLFDQLKNRWPRRSDAAAADAQAAPRDTASDSDVEALLSEIDQRLAAQSQAQPLGDGTATSAAAPLEALPSRLADGPDGPDGPATQAALPLIGHQSAAQQQRVLFTLIAVGAVVFALTAVLALGASGRQAKQLGTTGQVLMQSQRLAKSVSQALVGAASAFPEVRESSQVLAAGVRGLANGNEQVESVDGAAAEGVTELLPLVERAEKNATVVLGQQATLTQVGQALRTINRQSSDMLELAETVSSLKLQSNATPAELSGVGQLVMLTQRIGKSANEFLTLEGVSPEAVFLLGKDLITFREIADGLLKGSVDLRLPGTKDAATRERLEQLIAQYEQTRTQASSILGNLQGLVSAREAQSAIVGDSEKLRTGLEAVQSALESQGGLRGLHVLLLVVSLAAMLAGGVGILRLYVREQAQRAVQAEQQRLAAEEQEREAKRVNDANQAAILRLMNELQSVAEGDLTQQATVTEDITGAIADSVNYTVEELRNLVAQVQGTTERVAQTTQQVESTSTELLAASSEQLREIRETGESVLQMAARINQVSAEAQQTVDVARQSLEAALNGRQAVQDTIGGMNAIREQIQETSKRIKRLGESSQEIGEITELISDITEQTNVLALNAAIQAASAGEAGRGFSVVAEEVQRLAERSADATRQIAALVKTIQTDTQDAVAAMEHSTQGVVRGASLSDAAGSALADIDRVTRELSSLIGRISEQARREAESANVVAVNIQHIFAVTEQTGEGTRSTAQMVHELSRSARELRQSVDRFKIA
ncbi:type IV pili methyl-accepting chemotaxis transducer N-terminal domain-containing protein [Ideonella sp. 4Y16]|uniref:methyl-accepting chemotaxis protein n=1 Tax=Ideonella alba TaxID=2824118 RepID=UPI001B3682C3|nr:methyl-accepting chemotaxis protein [Ideonella alba]MBQ0945264.1 type IV pili methyl-accepting chemotaxis transducer N-terminal domain-containing protein [Ideonella alba]